MATEISLECSCGAVKGRATQLDTSPGNRVVCMCKDCQAYVIWLEREELLDANGGTELFQLRPNQVHIEGGREHLRCARLSPEGLMRWYAGCCNTPLGNTLGPRVAFFGMPVAFIEDGDEASRDRDLGPIIARIHGREGRGPLPADAHQKAPFWLLRRTLFQLFKGMLTGASKPSPVFDAKGEPVVTPTVLTLEERQRCTPS